jgi:hypothetical protein
LTYLLFSTSTKKKEWAHITPTKDEDVRAEEKVESRAEEKVESCLHIVVRSSSSFEFVAAYIST